jgi:protein-tyrosine-phosphatase
MKKLILVVCKGNIHRSVIAALCIEKMLKRLGRESEYETMSRGLQGSDGTEPPRFSNLRAYATEWLLTAPILEEIGIEIPLSQVATFVTEGVANDASLILAMDQGVLCGLPHGLINQFPHFGFKMRLFQELSGSTNDIVDCAGKTEIQTYRDTILAINSIVQNNIVHLLRLVTIFSSYIQKRNPSYKSFTTKR